MIKGRRFRSGAGAFIGIVIYGSVVVVLMASQRGDTSGGSEAKPIARESCAVSSPERAGESAWKPLLGIGIHEAYDSNVYWYPEGPLANRGSWVTSILTKVGAKYQRGESCEELIYAPDIAFYHDEPDENYVRHRFKAEGHQEWGTQWSVDSKFLLYVTDGNEESLVWTGKGGAPAFGGYEIRNRRDQLFSRHHVKIKYAIDENWFVRGRYDAKFRDFHVKNKTMPGYQNFYDRDEITGGLEIGREIASGLLIYAGYRFGVQDQENRAGSQINYSNRFHRIPFGLEGRPVRWLKLNVEVAPDFRQFGDGIRSGSPSSETYTYVNSQVAFYPGSLDRIELKHTRFLVPSSAGAGMFEDILYEASWNRKYSGDLGGVDLNKFSTMLGFQVYEEDFFPFNRRERRYSPKVQVKYQLSERVSASVDYSYEWTESEISNTPAREYTRHLVGLTVKMSY